MRTCLTSPLPSRRRSRTAAGRFDGRAADHRVAAGRIFRSIHLGEEGRQVVVLVLRPAFERMVMALVAVEARGQEQVRRVLHQRFGRAQRFVIRCGRVSFRRAAGGEDLAGELVVRCVGSDFAANPAAERGRAFDAEILAVHHQEVGPLVGPEIDVVVVADELVDRAHRASPSYRFCRRRTLGSARALAAGR